MEFPRKATKKNVDDFNTKNPNVKEIIDSIIHNKFMNDTLILDGEIPYDKIILELVRNYEIADSEGIEKILNKITENRENLYKLNIYDKNYYHMRKLKKVVRSILEDIDNSSEPIEIKLSDRIEQTDDLVNAVCNFVKINFSYDYNMYDDCLVNTENDGEYRIQLGKFFRQFIRENHFVEPQHYHCYAFNNNSDVLFTNVDHTFSEESMKYDFEEGYEIPISIPAPVKEENFLKQEKSPSDNVGCNIALMVVFAIFLFYIFIKVISG